MTPSLAMLLDQNMNSPYMYCNYYRLSQVRRVTVLPAIQEKLRLCCQLLQKYQGSDNINFLCCLLFLFLCFGRLGLLAAMFVVAVQAKHCDNHS